MSQHPRKPGIWFAEEWTVTLGGVLDSLSGERPTVRCKAPADDATLDSTSAEIARNHGAILWWKQAFPGDRRRRPDSERLPTPQLLRQDCLALGWAATVLQG